MILGEASKTSVLELVCAVLAGHYPAQCKSVIGRIQHLANFLRLPKLTNSVNFFL